MHICLPVYIFMYGVVSQALCMISAAKCKLIYIFLQNISTCLNASGEYTSVCDKILISLVKINILGGSRETWPTFKLVPEDVCNFSVTNNLLAF